MTAFATLGLDMDNTGYERQMSKSGGTAKDFEKQIDRSNRKMQKYFERTNKTVRRLTASFTLLGVGLVGLRAIEAADKFTRLRIELSTLLGTMSEANFIIKQLQKSVKNLPVNLTTLTGGFVKLRAAGVADTTRVLNVLTEGVLASGGSMMELEAAILAVSQMSGKGVVAMEELRRQLGQAIPSALILMAEGLGKTRQELFDLVKTGTLDAAEGIAALIDQMELAFGGQSVRFFGTFSGQIVNIKNSFISLIAVLEEQGLIKVIARTMWVFADALNSVTELLDTNKTALLDMSTAIEDFIVKFDKAVLVVVSFIAISVGLSVVVSIVRALTKAFKALALFASGPVGFFVLFASLIVAFKDNIVDIFTLLGAELAKAQLKLIKFLTEGITKAAEMAKKGFEFFVDIFTLLGAELAKAQVKLIKFLTEGITKAAKMAKKGFEFFGASVPASVTSVIKESASAIELLDNKIADLNTQTEKLHGKGASVPASVTSVIKESASAIELLDNKIADLNTQTEKLHGKVGLKAAIQAISTSMKNLFTGDPVDVTSPLQEFNRLSKGIKDTALEIINSLSNLPKALLGTVKAATFTLRSEVVGNWIPTLGKAAVAIPEKLFESLDAFGGIGVIERPDMVDPRGQRRREFVSGELARPFGRALEDDVDFGDPSGGVTVGQKDPELESQIAAFREYYEERGRLRLEFLREEKAILGGVFLFGKKPRITDVDFGDPSGGMRGVAVGQKDPALEAQIAAWGEYYEERGRLRLEFLREEKAIFFGKNPSITDVDFGGPSGIAAKSGARPLEDFGTQFEKHLDSFQTGLGSLIDAVQQQAGPLTNKLITAIASSKTPQEAVVNVIIQLIMSLKIVAQLFELVEFSLQGIINAYDVLFSSLEALMAPLRALVNSFLVIAGFYINAFKPFIDGVIGPLMQAIQGITTAVMMIGKFLGINFPDTAQDLEALQEVAPDGIIDLKLDASQALQELNAAHAAVGGAVDAEERRIARQIFLSKREAAILAEQQVQQTETIINVPDSILNGEGVFESLEDLFMRLDAWWKDFWSDIETGWQDFWNGLETGWQDFVSDINWEQLGIDSSRDFFGEWKAKWDALWDAADGILPALGGSLKTALQNALSFDSIRPDILGWTIGGHFIDQIILAFGNIIPGIILHMGNIGKALQDLFTGISLTPPSGGRGEFEKILNIDVPFMAFSQGGIVPGPNINHDIIPAMLTPGEQVIPKDQVGRVSGNTTINVVAITDEGGTSIRFRSSSERDDFIVGKMVPALTEMKRRNLLPI